MKTSIHDDIHMAIVNVAENGGSAAEASFLTWVLGALATSRREIIDALGRIKSGVASKDDANLIRSCL